MIVPLCLKRSYMMVKAEVGFGLGLWAMYNQGKTFSVEIRKSHKLCSSERERES